MSRPGLDVRVGTLVLHGIAARHAPGLRRALERELTAALSGARVPASARPGARIAIAVLQGGTVPVTPGHAPDVVARRLARVVQAAALGPAPARRPPSGRTGIERGGRDEARRPPAVSGRPPA